MKKLTDGQRRQERRKGLISGSETFRPPCAIRPSSTHLAKATLGKINNYVSVANLPNYRAKPG